MVSKDFFTSSHHLPFSHQLVNEWSGGMTKTAQRLSICLGQPLGIFSALSTAFKGPIFLANNLEIPCSKGNFFWDFLLNQKRS